MKLKKFLIQVLVVLFFSIVTCWFLVIMNTSECLHKKWIGDYSFNCKIFKSIEDSTFSTVSIENLVTVEEDRVNIDGNIFSLINCRSYFIDTTGLQKIETFSYEDPYQNLVNLHIVNGDLQIISIIIKETGEFVVFESNFNTLKI
jgi:hypothetical protein